jgi:3-keto-5-aminohexanoate cleavage enzyme
MASLDMGPFNREQHIITEHNRHNIEALAEEMREKGIKPELECFNNGHLNEAHRLIEKGLLEEPYYINIIFGHGTFTPPSPGNVLNMIRNLPEGAQFNLLAVGQHQLPLTTLSAIMGGHVRVGMEDNLYLERGVPVESNAQLVERSATILERLGCELATPAEAREMLGINRAKRVVNGH